MARRVAADSVDDFRHEVRVLSSAVAELTKKQTRPMEGLDKFADEQAKADSVMRVLGSAAEPPMSGETLVNYQIRMARKMQPHSKRWKDVNLNIIAADGGAFQNVLGEIRADAYEAGMKPVGLPEFEHRKITKKGAGGHEITEFVGTGTIFRQMARTPRALRSLNTTTSWRSRN
jgi:hypothetical protein